MSQALKTYSKGAPFYNVWLVDVRFRGSTSETMMLPRLLRHCYCYADSRFSNPMVSGLAAYAMKRCSMKRKSIDCDIRSLSACARTRILEAWSRSKPASLEYVPVSAIQEQSGNHVPQADFEGPISIRRGNCSLFCKVCLVTSASRIQLWRR